jgi:hypothetical protein
MPDELAGILIQFFDDADDLAVLAGSSLMHLPAHHDDLAGRLLSAAIQASTFALQPAQVVTAADQYQGDIPATVLEMAERFFALHQSQASDLRSSGRTPQASWPDRGRNLRAGSTRSPARLPDA